MRNPFSRNLFLAGLLFCCYCGSAGAVDLTATTNHIYIGVANDAGVKFPYDYPFYSALSTPTGTTYSTAFLPPGTDPANSYLVKADGGGTNELGISGTTTGGSVQNIASTSSTPSGSFYITNSGGRGFDNDLILALAMSGPIPDNFAVHVTSHGYTWTPAASGVYSPATSTIIGKTYIQGLDETFTKQDFVYGPQTVRPGPKGSLPIFSSENGVSPNPVPTTAASLMFIDLNVGNLRGTSFPGVTDQGAAKIDFSFSGLDAATKIAFNAYGWTSASFQGDGINFTNSMIDANASGYYLNVTPPESAAITYAPAGPYHAGTPVTISATFSQAVADLPVPMITMTGVNNATENMTQIDASHYSYLYTAGAGNGDVTVSLSGTNLASGNPVVSVPVSGATFTIDNTPPTVVSATPADGATEVLTDSQIAVTFSEALDAATINVDSFLLNGVTGSVAYDAVTKTASFTPSAALATSTLYTLTVTGAVKDLAGNAMAPAAWSFTTAAAPDTVSPTAALSYAPAGPFKVGTVVTVTATFSEAMAASPAPRLALSGADSLTAVDLIKVDVNHYSYSYAAGSGNGDVTVALSTGTDLAGNPVVSVPTSGALFVLDNASPTISAAMPVDAATKVAIDSQISVTFSEAMNAATITSSTFQVSGVTGSVSYDPATRIAKLTPTSALASGAAYTVTLSDAVKDLAGNTLAPASWGFTTTAPADSNPPTAEITYAPAGPYPAGTVVTVTATFSEAMAVSPVPRIALSGADSLAAVVMTRIDVNHYSYSYTAGSGSGDVTVALSTGTDLAGNQLVSAPTSGKTFTIFPIGNISGGAAVTIVDAVLALQSAVGLHTPTAQELSRGDVAPLVNGKPAPDGKIDIADAVVILRKVVGLENW